jgi:Ser/Thr protein kinase RdoA (MazF antagonist)
MSTTAEHAAEMVGRALELWGMSNATTALVAQRENEVHQIACPDGTRFALRLHRPGYRTEGELQSELDWMAMLHTAGLSVPEPQRSSDGHVLHEIGGRHVDLLTWLDGAPLWPTNTELDDVERIEVVTELGATTARIHELSDAWTPGPNFVRPDWGRVGLLGDSPLWGRFWEHPVLTSEERAVLERFRRVADEVLRDDSGLGNRGLDSGLIHADLVRENVLVSPGPSGRRLHIIDFDDSAFGYRLFDLATTIHTLRTDPHEALLREALLAGYTSVRSINTDQLELFEALRACTYVGWVVARLGETGKPERSARYIELARGLTTKYLSGPGS